MTRDRGRIMMDEEVRIVEAVLRPMCFQAHESCPSAQGSNGLAMALRNFHHEFEHYFAQKTSFTKGQRLVVEAVF